MVINMTKAVATIIQAVFPKSMYGVGSGAATTYFTNIAVGGSNPYKSIITVGTDKEYQTINAALSAVSKMTRTSSDRVTIMIDPGNYE